MQTGNKGEWSEPYALLKLIADGKLNLGDPNLNKLNDLFYPIIRIIKNEKDRKVEFTTEDEIVIVRDGENIFRIPLLEFVVKAKECFEEIKKGEKAFSIPDIESFLNSFNIKLIKEKSKNKNDITIQVLDPNSLLAPPLGFSIKSQLGQPSTLVNSSGVTNFTYLVKGNILSKTQIERINQTELFSDKFELLNKYGVHLDFEQVENRIFQSNLRLVGHNFDKLMGHLVLRYYINDIAKENRIANFLDKMAIENPVPYDLESNPDNYHILMQQFLIDYALGMRAGEVWKKEYQAGGGYLIVKKDGEIICYHFYFYKQFADYLLFNTKLDTGSTTRNKFGNIYEENGFQKMKLNLDIRFIK